MPDPFEAAAHHLCRARSAVALTGAGISVESGIPPFRGAGGLWEKIDPMQYAHIDALEHNPGEVWRVLFLGLKKMIEQAAPNDGHRGLFRLEQLGALQAVITQNIDGLHQMAGNREVIEFHGSFAVQRCMICDRRHDANGLRLEILPPRCACGGVLRPDVVMFGEAVSITCLLRAQTLAAACDVMLVIGTSATVEPAAFLPVIAKRNGAFVIEINPEKTPLSRISDATLLGPAGEMIQRLTAVVEKNR
jgi:NAD-dependent deacetylase